MFQWYRESAVCHASPEDLLPFLMTMRIYARRRTPETVSGQLQMVQPEVGITPGAYLKIFFFFFFFFLLLCISSFMIAHGSTEAQNILCDTIFLRITGIDPVCSRRQRAVVGHSLCRKKKNGAKKMSWAAKRRTTRIEGYRLLSLWPI